MCETIIYFLLKTMKVIIVVKLLKRTTFKNCVKFKKFKKFPVN